jgi:hypothetical protein
MGGDRVVISEMVKGRRVWRRELRGSVFTVVEFAQSDGAVFELFTSGSGRVASLGRFASRAAALRRVLGGDHG